MNNKFLNLFNNCKQKLKDTALTHSSYAHDNNVDSNERLEFLGDAVLQIIVSDYLFNHYHKDEGKMTKIRSSFVCTENLAELAKQIELEKHIKLGKSFIKKPVSNNILADAVESMIGATYLTYGLKIADAVVEWLNIKEKLKLGLTVTDFKSLLSEFCINNQKKLQYQVVTVATEDGQSTFRANVFVDNEFVAYGQGSAKRVAEQNAAKLAYNKIIKE